MPNAARAARSEQTAQTPRPRRVACDPDRPIAIPRDPDRDLALKDDEQKVLKALLSLAFEDRRMPGLRRWCCWAHNDTILDAVNQMGQAKGHSYFDRALKRLKAKGRVLSQNMTEFRRWLIEQAPRHGMSCDLPPPLRQRRGRMLIIVGELPPVVSEAYGPLEIPPPDSPAEHPDLRSSTPQSEEPDLLNLRSANRGEIPMDLPDYGSNSSSTCVCEPPTRTTDDDGMDPARETDPYRAQLLADIAAHPGNKFLRMALRSYDNPRAEEPRRPTTFVENPAAGRERSVVALSATTTDPRTPGDDDAPGGRIGRQTADRLAAQVRALRPGDDDQVDRIAAGLISAMDADHDDELVALYTGSIRLAASGGLADAVADAIRQAPNGANPRGLLKSLLRKISAAKNPPPGLLAKVLPAAGRNHYPRQPHCTVVK